MMKRIKGGVLLNTSLLIVLICFGCSVFAAGNPAGQDQRFTGELMVLVADDFQKQTSTVRYELLMDPDGENVPLNFLKPPALLNLTSGSRVEIRGRRHDGRIDVQALRILGPTPKSE
jgi:hypothetical protein